MTTLPQQGNDLLLAALAGLSPATAAAYRAELQRAGASLLPGLDDPAGELLDTVRAGTPSDAAAWLSSYRARLLEDGKAPATVARSVAAIRAAFAGLHTAGLCSWTIPRLRQRCPVNPVGDLRGPTPAELARLLEAAARQPGPRGIRNAALIRVSWDLALRRAELLALELSPDDPARVLLRRKGGGLTWATLPPQSLAAVSRWLRARGAAPGPLWASCTTSGEIARPVRGLVAGQWWRELRALGAAAGVRVRPHGLRHGAATAALAAGATVPAVAAYLGHAGLGTVQRYSDQLEGVADRIAALVAELPSIHLP